MRGIMKKKNVIIGSGIAATAAATVVGAATWIIGGMVYDGDGTGRHEMPSYKSGARCSGEIVSYDGNLSGGRVYKMAGSDEAFVRYAAGEGRNQDLIRTGGRRQEDRKTDTATMQTDI